MEEESTGNSEANMEEESTGNSEANMEEEEEDSEEQDLALPPMEDNGFVLRASNYLKPSQVLSLRRGQLCLYT